MREVYKTRSVSLMRMFVMAGCGLAVTGAVIAADGRRGGDEPPQVERSRLVEQDADSSRPAVLRIEASGAANTVVGQVEADAAAVRGTCPPTPITHPLEVPDVFENGGNTIAQAGFVSGEIAAAQYVLPSTEFPILLNLTEMVFVQNHFNSTTTEWSILVWDGPPDTGILVAEFSSDGTILPHIELPVGQAQGINVQFMIDPGDPEQIIINNDSGTNSFTVGYRIDQHNQPSANPCFVAPAENANAFPTTDTANPDQADAPTLNWLFALPQCPIINGWLQFSDLPGLLPGGDWNIRATYTSLSCVPAQGACCHGNTCSIEGEDDCENELGGVWLGADTVCAGNPCVDVPGACCLDGEPPACFDLFFQSDCVVVGGVFQGFGSECDDVVCFPRGACCVDGVCFDDTPPDDCASIGGVYQGDFVTCAQIEPCPEPTGACCFEQGVCIVSTQASCEQIATNVWLGPGTDCSPNPCSNPVGACCLDDGSCVETTDVSCDNAGGTFQGGGTTCSSVSCPQPQPCPWDCVPPGGNGEVNIDDLVAVVNAMSTQDLACDNSPDNGDGTFGNGVINFDDILGVVNNFGLCP